MTDARSTNKLACRSDLALSLDVRHTLDWFVEVVNAERTHWPPDGVTRAVLDRIVERLEDPSGAQLHSLMGRLKAMESAPARLDP